MPCVLNPCEFCVFSASCIFLLCPHDVVLLFPHASSLYFWVFRSVLLYISSAIKLDKMDAHNKPNDINNKEKRTITPSDNFVCANIVPFNRESN